MTIRCRAAVAMLLVLAGPALAQTPDRWQPIRDSIERQLVRVNGAAIAGGIIRGSSS